MSRSVYICMLSFLFFSCREKERQVHAGSTTQMDVDAADANLKHTNGNTFYHDKLFTGRIIEKFRGNTIKVACMAAGKQQGFTETFYEDGSKESKRYFTKGEKDSVHIGWWPNGTKKYEYHFTHDNYNGLFTEWYASGKMMQQIMYANGAETWGKGWRENSKPYMNFVTKSGRRYGLVNANLCYNIDDGKVR